MADWQGSTPGNTPGYGNTGPGQAWDANRRDPAPAPWPQASPPSPPPSQPQWPQASPPSPPAYQQQPQHQPQHHQHHQQHASTTARDTVEQAKERAVHLASDAREQVTQRVESGLDRGKARAADTLGGVAQTLLQSSQQLRQQQPQLGDYAERAAREMQRFSDYLQRADVHELVDRAEDVARRQPALFLGGMFALGLVGARFLRSSRRAQRPTYDRGSAAFDHASAERYGPDYPPRPTASYGQDSGATPSPSPYGGARYGNASYGATQPVYGGYGSTQPLDRDVTDRQRVASEPSYGAGSSGASGATGGAADMGQEVYRRRESAWDVSPDERTQPGGIPRPSDPGYRAGDGEPRGGGQP